MRVVENIKDVVGVNMFEIENLYLPVFMNYFSYVTWKNKQIEKEYKQKNI